MISLTDIQAWVRSGESETLELKKSTGERREAAKTICAMLNHRGGRVILGVDPDGRLLGQNNRQFHGNTFDLLFKAERFLRENLPVAWRVVPHLFERIDDPLYPPEALRETLANAFCHRDYSIGGGSISVGVYDDRLEITSTGTFHFGITPESLFRPHESMPWNPLIARVFYRRGIIESWGRGTIKMGELTDRAGLPAPEIEEYAGCVTVRFRPTRYVPPTRVAQISPRASNTSSSFLAPRRRACLCGKSALA